MDEAALQRGDEIRCETAICYLKTTRRLSLGKSKINVYQKL